MSQHQGSQKPNVPVLEGWFTEQDGKAYLLGSRCAGCGTYYFPRQSSYCRNPACDSEQFEEVPLSRTGKIWSFTNACYEPPEPFIAAKPFVPYTIAAVELEHEKMIVLGQVIEGVNVSDLKAGRTMELVIAPLNEEENAVKTVWKWQPVGGVN